MNKRDQQIAEIAASKANLNESLLSGFYELVRGAYEQASIVDHIAIVRATDDRTPSDFRVLTNQELRPTNQFNDKSYVWDMYCRELARSIALAEKAHIFEILQRQVPDRQAIPGVGFEGLNAAVTELEQLGYAPDAILAPISYMVGLSSQLRKNLEWDNQGRELLTYGVRRLNVYWSGGGRPLDRFIVFDHRAGVWNVKLDPTTHTRLTVAIGEQPGPPRGVVWLAETVAKYEVANLDAFRSFRPDAPTDEGFPVIR